MKISHPKKLPAIIASGGLILAAFAGCNEKPEALKASENSSSLPNIIPSVKGTRALEPKVASENANFSSGWVLLSVVAIEGNYVARIGDPLQNREFSVQKAPNSEGVFLVEIVSSEEGKMTGVILGKGDFLVSVDFAKDENHAVMDAPFQIPAFSPNDVVIQSPIDVGGAKGTVGLTVQSPMDVPRTPGDEDRPTVVWDNPGGDVAEKPSN